MKSFWQFLENYQWVAVLLRLTLALLVTHLCAQALKKAWHRTPSSSQLLYRRFIYNILLAVIYLVGGLTAISQIPHMSQVTQTILAGSGIFALAISLSAQESLNNIISGFFITLFKPFEVGNRVVLVNQNITGLVEDITLRHTVIKTFVNTRVVIPNSTMNKEIIENSNLFDNKASAFVDVCVSYDSNVDQAIAIMAKIIGNHPRYLDMRSAEDKKTQPKVKVFVRELGTRGVLLRANMWTQTVDENFEACSDVRLAIKKAFDSVGIVIPAAEYIGGTIE